MSRKGRRRRNWAYLGRAPAPNALSDASDEKRSAPVGSRPLIHYTTASGLMGILKTKTLFATHADFLNDSTECQLLKKILAPQLAAEFGAAGHLMKRVDLWHKTPDEMVDVVFRSILITIEETSPFYITSFCLHPPETREYEHGLLSQWRGYANGGFAIEFDEADLDRQTVLENEAFSHARFPRPARGTLRGRASSSLRPV